MRKIYDISKGQLIAVWVFGLVGMYLAMQESCNWYKVCQVGWNGRVYTEDIIILILAFILVFYSIGWRNYRKTAKGN